VLALACWPPEVRIDNPPEERQPARVVAEARPPAASPAQSGAGSAVEAPLPARPAAPAPSAMPADAGPCGLDGTPCCAPANACADGLDCDLASGLCRAAEEAPASTGGAVSAPSAALRFNAGPAQAEHGGIGGEPFSQLCPAEQVVIGIRAFADDNLWGLGLNCGQLQLSPSGDAISVLPLEELPVLGGGLEPVPPLIGLSCPPQMVVTAVGWSLWQPFTDQQQVVKQLQLTCSELLVGPERQLRQGAAAVGAAGVVGDSTEPVLQSCGEQGAVSGFTGRSGAAIDALATSCVTLSLEAP
jgi:hypothetical protein